MTKFREVKFTAVCPATKVNRDFYARIYTSGKVLWYSRDEVLPKSFDTREELNQFVSTNSTKLSYILCVGNYQELLHKTFERHLH